MKAKKLFFILLVGLQAEASQEKFWSKLNHRLAALNPRFRRATTDLPDEKNVPDASDAAGINKIWAKLGACLHPDNDKKLFSLKDIHLFEKLSDGQFKPLADHILKKNNGNVARAAREVKCVILALIAGIVIYRNREALGKKWEQVKDVIAGVAIVWLCYAFRHQLFNGVSNLATWVKGAFSAPATP